MKIEVHGHVVFQESFGKAGKYGPERIELPDGGMGMRIGPYLLANAGSAARATSPEDAAERMRRMSDPHGRVEWLDERGIDKMVNTISPLWYLYWAEPEIAIPFAELQNDLLAKYCDAVPDRLFWAATLPMQDIDASVRELKRVAGMGAKAVNIGTDNFGGKNFDDELFWPLYEELVNRDMPIFLHPYPIPMEDGREDKYNLSWVTGYIYQETNAFAHFTLGGVLDDFPSLRIYNTHGGGFVPYHFGRIEAARTTEQPGVRAKKPIAEYLDNFYFDIHVHDLKSRQFLVDFMGADRLVVGSNVGGWDSADGFALLDELKLPEEDHDKIAWKNAARFFNI